MMDAQSKLAGRASRATVSAMTRLRHEARAAEAAGETITWLQKGDPDFATPAHVVAAGQKAIADGFSHYTEAEGVLPLREAIADHLGASFGLSVDPKSEVLVTNGASMGLFSALMAVLNEGDELIVLEPYYGMFARITDLCGGSLVAVPLAREGDRLVLDVDAIASRVGPRTKAVLINTPMNPTGRVFTKEELGRLGALAVERDLVLISDECYDSIVFDGRRFESIAALAPEFRERTIIVNSFSKTYAMTGWRLGYNVASPVFTQAMIRIYSQSGMCAAAFTQQAGIAALRGPQDVVRSMCNEYQRRRDLVVSRLAAIGLPCGTPEGTFFAFIDCTRFGMPSFQVAQHVLRVGRVALTPGEQFGPAGDTYLRLSFAASDEALERGLAGLRAALEALPTVARPVA